MWRKQQKYGRAQFQTDRRKDEVHGGAEALREDFVDSRVQPTAPFVYDTDTIKMPECSGKFIKTSFYSINKV